MTSGSIRRLNRYAEIYSNHITCSPRCCELCMPPFATASFKDNLVKKELGIDRFDPTEKLFCVTFVLLHEVSPLPAETCSSCLLVALYFIQIGESRNPAGNQKAPVTSNTTKTALKNFDILCAFD